MRLNLAQTQNTCNAAQLPLLNILPQRPSQRSFPSRRLLGTSGD
jgi:hypothetical protein